MGRTFAERWGVDYSKFSGRVRRHEPFLTGIDPVGVQFKGARPVLGSRLGVGGRVCRFLIFSRVSPPYLRRRCSAAGFSLQFERHCASLRFLYSYVQGGRYFGSVLYNGVLVPVFSLCVSGEIVRTSVHRGLASECLHLSGAHHLGVLVSLLRGFHITDFTYDELNGAEWNTQEMCFVGELAISSESRLL